MFFEHDIILETPKLGTIENIDYGGQNISYQIHIGVTEASMDIKTTVHKIGWP